MPNQMLPVQVIVEVGPNFAGLVPRPYAVITRVPVSDMSAASLDAALKRIADHLSEWFEGK